MFGSPKCSGLLCRPCCHKSGTSICPFHLKLPQEESSVPEVEEAQQGKQLIEIWPALISRLTVFAELITEIETFSSTVIELNHSVMPCQLWVSGTARGLEMAVDLIEIILVGNDNADSMRDFVCRLSMT